MGKCVWNICLFAGLLAALLLLASFPLAAAPPEGPAAARGAVPAVPGEVGDLKEAKVRAALALAIAAHRPPPAAAPATESNPSPCGCTNCTCTAGECGSADCPSLKHGQRTASPYKEAYETALATGKPLCIWVRREPPAGPGWSGYVHTRDDGYSVPWKDAPGLVLGQRRDGELVCIGKTCEPTDGTNSSGYLRWVQARLLEEAARAARPSVTFTTPQPAYYAPQPAFFGGGFGGFGGGGACRGGG